MIDINVLKRCRITFDFSFFAVIAIFLCFDYTGYGIFSIIACLLHELGHLTAMLIEGKTPEGIRFYGGGIKLSRGDGNPSYFVLLSGCAMNLVLFALFYFLSDKLSIFPLVFATMNLVIGIFNLMPVGHLDGKKIFEKILISRFSIETAYAAEKFSKILKIVERVIFLSVLSGAVLFVFTNKTNFTLIIVLCYVLMIDWIR
ncbi:MAG: M50 family metallopeptidase [Eubacterium sp.]|jgi:Zn-dependent protease|nr:M50 family metallopeptidase [Eubacterium sp.]